MKGIKRKLRRATERIDKYIYDKTDRTSLHARGLAREGYDGGYSDALTDVLSMLNGVNPCRHPEYWENEK